jgi:hypothetical protein
MKADLRRKIRKKAGDRVALEIHNRHEWGVASQQGRSLDGFA